MSSVAESPYTATPQRRLVRIQRVSGFSLDVWELLAYHELLYFMVWRDLKVRYKQTALGVLWAIIQPFTAMVLFSLIFGGLAGIKGGHGVPYPLFVYAGLLPWTYFSTCLSAGGTSVVTSAPLVTKVYFPRLLLPLASVVVPVIDFLCSLAILAGLFAWYGRVPTWRIATMPLMLGLAFLSAFGIGLWLSALNVRYRDVRYMVSYITQVWLYLTPVIYPTTLLSAHLRWLFALNPVTGAVDGFRWSVLGVGNLGALELVLSLVVGAALTMSGVWYFRRVERRFADVI